jgi:hypothetical protein
MTISKHFNNLRKLEILFLLNFVQIKITASYLKFIETHIVK